MRHAASSRVGALAGAHAAPVPSPRGSPRACSTRDPRAACAARGVTHLAARVRRQGTHRHARSAPAVAPAPLPLPPVASSFLLSLGAPASACAAAAQASSATSATTTLDVRAIVCVARVWRVWMVDGAWGRNKPRYMPTKPPRRAQIGAASRAQMLTVWCDRQVCAFLGVTREQLAAGGRV
jgi:hypothetical protein